MAAFGTSLVGVAAMAAGYGGPIIRKVARLRRHALGRERRDCLPVGRRHLARGHGWTAVHRRDRRALVLQRRVRAARDRVGGGGSARAPFLVLVVRGVYDRTDRPARRAPGRHGADRGRRRIPGLGWLGGDRHRGEARPALLGCGRQAPEARDRLARALLSRHGRVRHVARGHPGHGRRIRRADHRRGRACARARRCGPLGAVRGAGGRDRGVHRRAGDRRRRRHPAGRGLLAGGLAAVPRARGAADRRRGRSPGSAGRVAGGGPSGTRSSRT